MDDQVRVVTSHAPQAFMFCTGDHAASVEPENLFRRLSPHEAPQPEDQHGYYVLVDQAIIGTADATTDDPIVHLSASCLS